MNGKLLLTSEKGSKYNVYCKRKCFEVVFVALALVTLGIYERGMKPKIEIK